MPTIYLRASPYAEDALNLPVANVDDAISFYENIMGFTVSHRETDPVSRAILSRDSVEIGLAENGGDPSQEGCFFEIDNAETAFTELVSNGLNQSAPNFRVDTHGETRYKVFFVIAPDGLCYCLGERLPK